MKVVDVIGAGIASSRAARVGLAVASLLVIIMPARVFAQSPPDVVGHWAEGRIRELLARRIVETFPDGSFRPHEPLSRARFIAWIVAAKGLPLLRPATPGFADVPPEHPLAPYLEAALAYGVVPATPRLRPEEPVTRGEAVDLIVRALGYTFESAYMAGVPVPYADVHGLPPALRGAVGVAALASPPLLREPPSPRLRPAEPLTRGEGAALVGAYLEAVERGITLRATFPLGTGTTLVLEKRGALRTLPVWRVQVGAFTEPDRAARLAEQMRARGLPAFVDVLDEFHKVRVGNFATRAEAQALADRLRAEGFPTWVILTLRDFETQPGPFWAAYLVLEPAAGVRLRPALGGVQSLGRGRPSEVARRYGALAAVNGGFYAPGGDPLGCLVIDGVLISEPVPGRSCAALLPDGQVLFDQVSFAGSVATEVAAAPVHGVNRERGPNELIVYRAAFGPSTRTNVHGVEAVVVGDVVQQVVEGRGNAAIPPDGYVLSGHGTAGAWLRQALRPGDRVTLRLDLVPASGDPRWAQAPHVVGGGPRLLAGGRYVGGEGFTDGFLHRRHPRTALARLADGRLLLVVVDGRQPYHSLGMTLPELAATLAALGATDALNLDGGGSTTLVVRGTVVNLPSDESGERPVSDVLLVQRP